MQIKIPKKDTLCIQNNCLWAHLTIYNWSMSFDAAPLTNMFFIQYQIFKHNHVAFSNISQAIMLMLIQHENTFQSLFCHQGGIKCRIQPAKDLIDKKDPEHTLFCCETAFVAIYMFFSGKIFPSFDGNSNTFTTFIEQKSFRQNRMANNRIEYLSK